MDWQTLFAGMGAGLAFVTAVCTFNYWVVQIMVKPLIERLDELTKAVNKLGEEQRLADRRIKSEGDLASMISLAIHEHTKECAKNKRDELTANLGVRK